MNTISLPHEFLSKFFWRDSEHRGAIQYRSLWTILLVLSATWPLMEWFVKRVNDGGDEPWGIIPLVAALYFLGQQAWRNRAENPSLRMVAGAFLLLVAALCTLHVPPMLRACLAIPGLCLLGKGPRSLAIACLLLLSLPVIASLQFFVGWPLRWLVSEAAAGMLSLFGIAAEAKQALIQVGDHTISVDPACSGIRFLWHGAVVAAWLAAWRGVSARATGLMLGSTLLLVLLANILRACLLCLQQTGHLPGGDLVHELLGLLCFAVALWPLLAWPWDKWFPRPQPTESSRVAPILLCRSKDVLLVAAAVAATMLGLVKPWVRPSDPVADQDVREFTFRGTKMNIVAIPLEKQELDFAAEFPGKIGVYATDGGQVILRDVECATRKLHPSRDCLRASGFALSEAKDVLLSDGTWNYYTASRDGTRYDVYERIMSSKDGTGWTDVSAWFWSALRHPLNGPWRAETVLLEKGALR